MTDSSVALSRSLEAYQAAQLQSNELSFCFPANCAQNVMMRNPLGGGESRGCQVTLDAKKAALLAREETVRLPVFPIDMDLSSALAAIGSKETQAFDASVLANIASCPATCPRHRQSASQS